MEKKVDHELLNAYLMKFFLVVLIMEIEGERWRIRALHTGKGRTLRGKRTAIDLRRIYLHPPYKEEEDGRQNRR